MGFWGTVLEILSTKTVRDLADAFKENSLAFEREYKGKSFYVRGYVEYVDSEYLSIGEDESNKIFCTYTVSCHFPSTFNDRLARLKKGKSVTVHGVYDGLTSGGFRMICDELS